MLVDTFINAIFLYDDKAVITFNYKEGGKTITLEDITSSDMELAGAPKKDCCGGLFYFLLQGGSRGLLEQITAVFSLYAALTRAKPAI